jgi:CxxC-x17-CxxC domain-containing protein
MARFEHSRERRDSKPRERDFKGSSKRNTRGRRSFEDHPRGDFDRGSNHYSRDRRDFERTKVTCSSCGKKCEVPFKPSSNKPVYCDDCFTKKGKVSNGISSQDIDVINEKLNKIMKALEIE